MQLEARQAEILRAVQRDDALQKRLYESASSLITGTCGPLTWIKWRYFIEKCSTFAYQALTTLSYRQTLGEEYTGIIHWTEEQKLPSRYAQLLMVLLNCFGEHLVLQLIERFENYLQHTANDRELRPEAKVILLSICKYSRKLIPILLLLHQTCFYFQGRYFHLSKRATSIRYRLVRFWLGDKSLSQTFRVLGVISLLHCCVTLVTSLRELSADQVIDLKENVMAASGATCSLCLNLRRNTSTTPCGHLFCWGCIMNWVQEQPFCPLCRQSVHPSRVVHLQNYDKIL